MKNSIILKIALATPLQTLFDYKPPQGIDAAQLPIGARVKVPFGQKTMIGFIAGSGNSEVPSHKLKEITEVLENESFFPKNCWQFLRKAQEYYHHSLGEVLTTGLPSALKEGKALNLDEKLNKHCFIEGDETAKPPTLTLSQQQVTSQILDNLAHHSTYLLEGVTGSGKTEIYLQLLTKIQQQNQSALVLLPEISLTPQTMSRFAKRLKGKIFIYHSKLTPKARLQVWSQIYHRPNSIVLGTRSALFLPFKKLSAIIVDEEHDASFKQQEGFKYSARDLSVLKGHLEQCPVILGSATPSFESLHNIDLGKYQHLQLTQRINQDALPKIEIIDVRHKKLDGGLSASLIAKIKTHVEQNNQVLIFLNRRGYAPTYMCYECGYSAHCQRCDAKLILHHAKNTLVCHHCDKIYRRFEECPECESPLNPVGIGTEKLDETLNTFFPANTILRIDSDTTRKKGELEEKLELIRTNKAQILIGTQLLAKGHHFPNITFVAIIDVDGGLFSADFRAVERMGQLVTQVAGRAGREEKQGQVVLQTFHPEHPLLLSLVQQGYPIFAKQLLEERQKACLPPFSHMAIIRAQAKSSENPQQFLQELKRSLDLENLPVEVLGPISALLSKKQGFHRYLLLLQSSQRSALHRLLFKLNGIINRNALKSKVRWSLDVDPIEIR